MSQDQVQSQPLASKQAQAPVEIGIVTCKPESMLHFYRDAIGFELFEAWAFPDENKKANFPIPSGYQYRLRVGQSVLKLVVYDEAPSAHASHPPYAATGIGYLTIPVDNLNATIERCRAHDYEPQVPLHHYAGDIYFTFYQDPDGNWIELYGAI